MSRILIVDDEPQILRMLRASLQGSGYEVVQASNGLEAFEVFEKSRPDLIVTDMSMPVMDGFGLTQEIRRVSKVPIVILSVRDGEPQKVAALDAGADDYVTKPFNMPELLARIRVQLRRSVESVRSLPSLMEAGDFRVDDANHSAEVRGSKVHLTPKEYDLLLLFLQNADRVLTHRFLAKSIWKASGDGQTDNLRVLIGQLRRKIETDEYRYVQSEPWVGYRFVPSGDRGSL